MLKCTGNKADDRNVPLVMEIEIVFSCNPFWQTNFEFRLHTLPEVLFSLVMIRLVSMSKCPNGRITWDVTFFALRVEFYLSKRHNRMEI